MAAGSSTLFSPQPRSLLPAAGPQRVSSARRPHAWRRLAASERLAQPVTTGQSAGDKATALTVVDKAETALVPVDQPSAPESPAPAGEQPARFSLYNWLRFGGLPTATASTAAPAEPAAEAPVEPPHACVSQFGDGMAAEPLPVHDGTAWARGRRGFLALRRGSPSHRQSPAEQLSDPQLNPDHPTLRLLRQRLSEGSRPGSRTDGYKLGLVVEGGGMRGCVSGGGLQALSDLGMRDVFDVVYGSSAGAINSTYFLAGQREGVYIYHDHIAHNEFIDLKRLWKNEAGGPAVLNLPYLLEYVMHHVSPLDWDAVLQSEIPLKVVASSLDSLQPIILDNFACKKDLQKCLKASANVPEIAGTPIEHRGHRLVDAAVFEPVPFRSAIADGCTHVLVLCTRPKRERNGVLTPLEDAIEAAIKKAILSPSYMVDAWKAEVEYMAKDGLSQDEMLLRSFDEDAHELPWFAGTHVFPLYPGPAASFSPLCTDVPTLKAGVAEGKRAVMRLAQALLRDSLEAGPPRDEVHESNIMPLTAELSAAAGGGAKPLPTGGISRLWRR